MKTFYDPLNDGFIIDSFFNLDATAQTENPEVIAMLWDYFSPVHITVSKVNCSSWWCAKEECIRTGFEQFKRLAECMEKILEHEKSAGYVYEFVLRIRPDILFHTELPPSHCWKGLRRDVVWDSDALFFGDQNVRVDKASRVDFIMDFFKIIPREHVEAYMSGIAKSYDACIPEIQHTAANHAVGGTELLRKLYGDDFSGGCGKDKHRWRWNECRDIITLQKMDIYVGRVQETYHEAHPVTALARCRDTGDIWCADAFSQLTGESITEGVTSRTTCFPSDGYIHQHQETNIDRFSDHEANRNMVTSSVARVSQLPKIAVCMVGDVRSLVRVDARRNLHEAVYKPLSALHVDTFAFVGDTLIKGNSDVKANLSVSDVLFGKSKPVVTQISTDIRKRGAMLSTRPTCQVLGYAEVVRLRDCVSAVMKYENALGIQYDFILRTRPDIEYFESLPPAHCWRGLNPLVIWDMDTRFATAIDKLNVEKVKSVLEADFVGDWLTLAPRDIAVKAFKSMADDFERCISLSAPEELICGESNHRWGWPECRFKHAYIKANSRSLVGKLMTETGQDFQWNTVVRCQNADCSDVSRQDGQQHCHERVCA